MRIRKIWVNSEAAEAIGYNRRKKILRVWYMGGKVYDYFDVPLDAFADLQNATSIGTHLNKIIKRNYSYKAVGQRIK